MLNSQTKGVPSFLYSATIPSTPLSLRPTFSWSAWAGYNWFTQLCASSSIAMTCKRWLAKHHYEEQARRHWIHEKVSTAERSVAYKWSNEIKHGISRHESWFVCWSWGHLHDSEIWTSAFFGHFRNLSSSHLQRYPASFLIWSWWASWAYIYCRRNSLATPQTRGLPVYIY